MVNNQPLAIQRARNALASSCVVLDTETTGLSDSAEIIELAIINATGVLYDGRFNPTSEIDLGAEAVHGISRNLLDQEPRFSAQLPMIKPLLLESIVVIFNATFDLRLLRQTLDRYRLGWRTSTVSAPWTLPLNISVRPIDTAQ